MADRFLTISEAENFPGKSRSTLRRFIDSIVKVDKSPDRHLVIPTPEEAQSLKEQSQPFAWRISEELLRRQFLKPEASEVPEHESGSGGVGSGDSSRLVAVLEKSIAMLERELNEKNSQINAMNERLRESNILMKDLQARLALPSGKPTAVEEAGVAAAAESSPKPESDPKKKHFLWPFVR